MIIVLGISEQEDFHWQEILLEKTREIDDEARTSKKAEMKRKFNRNQKRITPWDIQLSSLTSLLKQMHAYCSTGFIKLWNYGCTYFKGAPLNNLTKNDFFVGDYWLWISSTKNTVKSEQNKFKTILCVSLFFPAKLLCN